MFAYEQLEETTDGRIAFALRKRRKNGDTHRFFTPMQFLRRLAWLIVPPRQALVRYEGVLAPAAKWRALVVPPPPAVSLAQNLAAPLQLADPALPARAADPTKTTPTRAAAMRWAALLRRVYDVDALRCSKPACDGRMRVVSAITSPRVIRRILEHLGLPLCANVDETPTLSAISVGRGRGGIDECQVYSARLMR